jgi:antitoxin VapB
LKTAKVFMNGRSQAIRLPRDFRVNGTEVYIKRVPEGILIMERDPWEIFREGIAEMPEGAFEWKREQPPLQERDWMK